jgi:hypothetical protein
MDREGISLTSILVFMNFQTILKLFQEKYYHDYQKTWLPKNMTTKEQPFKKSPYLQMSYFFMNNSSPINLEMLLRKGKNIIVLLKLWNQTNLG